MLDAVVVIPLIPGDPTDGCLHGEVITNRLHVGDHPWVVGRQRPEQEDAVVGGIDRHVQAVIALLGRNGHPSKALVFGDPEVLQHGVGHAPGSSQETLFVVHGPHVTGKFRGRLEGTNCRGHGEGVDAPPLFPQVPAWLRQAVVIAMLQQPVGARNHDRVVQRLEEFHIPVDSEVFAQRPQHQRGFVLLHGEHLATVQHFGVPRRREGPVGVVLVTEPTRRFHDVIAEAEEGARQLGLPRQRQPVRHQGTVPRPHVRVRVAGERLNVRIVGGQNGPPVVDLGAQHQLRTHIHVSNGLRQRREIDGLFEGPEPPVGFGSIHHAAGGLQGNLVMKIHQRFARISTRQPHGGAGHASGRDVQMKANGGIHRALRDGIAGKMPVFRITPGALGITNALGTRREVFNPVPQRIFTGDQEPTLVFVVHHALKFRIEVGGVPHRRRINGQVVVNENARVPHLSGEVFHFEGTEPHRRVIIHNVRAADGDAQTIVPQQTVGCECLGLVAQVTLPLVVVDPSKLAIHPEPKTLRIPLRVVRHPNPRPEQVTGLVAVVKCNHQFAVADGQITRHGTGLRRGVSDAKGSKCTAGRIVAVQSSVSRSSSLAKAEMRAAGSPTLVICTAARSPSRHA